MAGSRKSVFMFSNDVPTPLEHLCECRESWELKADVDIRRARMAAST